MVNTGNKKPSKPAPNGKVSVAAKKKLLPQSVAATQKKKTSGVNTNKNGDGVLMPFQAKVASLLNNSVVSYGSNAIPLYPYPSPYHHVYPTQPYHHPFSYPMMQMPVPPSRQAPVPGKQQPLPTTKAAAKNIDDKKTETPEKKNDSPPEKKAPASVPVLPSKSSPNPVKPQLTPMQKKYKLMAGLNMSVDPTNQEATKQRHELLHELLRFEEQERKDSRPIVKTTRDGKISHTILRIEGQTEIVTKPLHDGQLKQQLYHDCTNVLYALRPPSTDTEQPKDAAVTTLCQWLSEYHNDHFLATMDHAQNRRANLNVPMHDGGDRHNPAHTQWNVMYEKLVAFHKENGHCRVLKRKKNGTGTEAIEEQKLGRWVIHQRKLRKANKPILTPQRIALLNKLDFTWEITPRKFVDDPRMWKAVAVKVCFGLVTPREAMLLAGYSWEDASKQIHATGLNMKVAAITTRENRIVNQDKVEDIMTSLRADSDAALDDIFGKENATLKDLRQKGKFVLGPAVPVFKSEQESEEEQEYFDEMEGCVEIPEAASEPSSSVI